MFSTIISDPNLDYLEPKFGTLPIVIIERLSIGGMSGSPAFVWPNKRAAPIFVGILSGNTHDHAFFWRKDVIVDLIDSIRLK